MLVDGHMVGTWQEPLGNNQHRWLDDTFARSRIGNGRSRPRHRDAAAGGGRAALERGPLHRAVPGDSVHRPQRTVRRRRPDRDVGRYQRGVAALDAVDRQRRRRPLRGVRLAEHSPVSIGANTLAGPTSVPVVQPLRPRPAADLALPGRRGRRGEQSQARRPARHRPRPATPLASRPSRCCRRSRRPRRWIPRATAAASPGRATPNCGSVPGGRTTT